MVLIATGRPLNNPILLEGFRPLAGIMVLIATGRPLTNPILLEGFRPLAGIMVLINRQSVTMLNI